MSEIDYLNQENYFNNILLGKRTYNSTIQFYPVDEEVETDSYFRGSIEGHDAVFEHYVIDNPNYAHTYSNNYIRFASNGSVFVALLFRFQFKYLTLHGFQSDIPIDQDRHICKFTLPGPGCYYLDVKDLAREDVIGGGPYTIIFWIDDLDNMNASSMDLEDPGVTNVIDNGIQPDKNLDQTSEIQALLDLPGVKLYFPQGMYRCGTINLKSDSRIYLAPGAIIKAVDDEDKIEDRAFIYAYNVSNISLFGKGIIDANNHELHNLKIEDSSEVHLQDIFIRGSDS
jgi:hypothetical protein